MNACLNASGLAPLSDPDAVTLDAGLANEKVDEATHDILAQGWWFNTEVYYFTIDANNEVKVPGNTLAMRTVGYNRLDALIVRSGKLYDPIDHTHDMSGLVNADNQIVITIFLLLDLEDLPAKGAIAVRDLAIQLMVADKMGDDKETARREKKSAISIVNLKVEHAVKSKYNSIESNTRLKNIVRKIQGDNGLNHFTDYKKGVLS